jgi:hypothetical protein
MKMAQGAVSVRLRNRDGSRSVTDLQDRRRKSGGVAFDRGRELLLV